AAHYDWCYRASHRSGAAHIAASRDDVLRDRLRWYDTAHAATSSRLDRQLRTSAPPHLRTALDRRPAGESPADPVSRPGTCPRPALGRRAYTQMIARAQQYI